MPADVWHLFVSCGRILWHEHVFGVSPARQSLGMVAYPPPPTHRGRRQPRESHQTPHAEVSARESVRFDGHIEVERGRKEILPLDMSGRNMV